MLTGTLLLMLWFIFALTGCEGGAAPDKGDGAKQAVVQTQKSATNHRPIVNRVDHIIIQTADAQALFALLTDTLELPVAWPLRSYGFFTSGGAFAGNVNIEILLQSNANESKGPRFAGLAFEPAESAEASVAILDNRKISHGPVLPYFGSENGNRRRLWSSVFLNEMGVPDSMMLLCDYSWDVEERRLPLRDELTKRKGGPLTIEGVRRIVIGVSNFDEHRNAWESLLKPHVRKGLVWHCGDGPTIQLVANNEADAMSLDIEVSSVKRAREFTGTRDDVSLAEDDGSIWLTGPLLGDLRIRVVE
jgi:hypothetical protein